MNLFYLDRDPYVAAEQHCDKHVVKMIIEYAQLLSTAHRLLDGKLMTVSWEDLRIKKRQLVQARHNKKMWLLEGESVIMQPDVTLLGEINEGPLEQRIVPVVLNNRMYAASHINHPTQKWSAAASGNYTYLYCLFDRLCQEYTKRYGKVHSTAKLLKVLGEFPENITYANKTDPPLSMPDEYKVDDAVTAYQNLYVGAKSRFAKWTNTEPPKWFQERFPNYDSANFVRTRNLSA